MTNVYKHKHFVSKCEKVRIPDGEDFELQANSSAEETHEFILQSEDDDVSLPNVEEPDIESDSQEPEASDEENQETTEPVTESVEEEQPALKIPTKEELKAIYDVSLKELATSVAQQAYYDALNKKKAELRECIASVQSLMNELRSAHDQFMEEYTNELKYMAIDIAEKIIIEKIDEDDLILKRLVLQTISNVKNAEWLNVEISEKLIGLIDAIKKDLEKPEYNGKAFVFPVADSTSVCRVISKEGTIVSTIEVQADNLRRAFRESDRQ